MQMEALHKRKNEDSQQMDETVKKLKSSNGATLSNGDLDDDQFILYDDSNGEDVVTDEESGGEEEDMEMERDPLEESNEKHGDDSEDTEDDGTDEDLDTTNEIEENGNGGPVGEDEEDDYGDENRLLIDNSQEQTDNLLNGLNEIISRTLYNNLQPNDLQCKKCLKVFARKSYLRGHLCTEDLKVNNKALKCKFCSKRYSHKINLRLHLKLHNNPKQWQCNVCLKYLSSSSSLKVHLKTHSSQKPFKCDHCSFAFNQKVHLNDHILSHHEKVRPYNCHLCSKTYISKSVLKKHLKKHFGLYKHECELCAKRFFEKSALKKHMRTHSSNFPLNKLRNDDPMQCSLCLHYFHFKYKLIAHFILEHSLGKVSETCIQCPLCEIRFNIVDDEPSRVEQENRNSVNSMHRMGGGSMVMVKTEDGATPNGGGGVGSVSGNGDSKVKDFSTSVNNLIAPDYPTHLNDHKRILAKLRITPRNMQTIISEHIKSHEYVENHMCELCYKVYESKDSLGRHMKIHDNKEKQRFGCEHCDKRFMTNSDLNKHVSNVHDRLKPHECDLCGKNFSQRNNLKRHLEEVHRTNGVTFECHVCQKILSTSHSLKRHLLIHNGPKYSCEVCAREFTRVYELNIHRKLHETQTDAVTDSELRCKFCNKLFLKKCNLRAHVENKHLDYTCLECKEFDHHVSFETKKMLLLHLKSKHKNVISKFYLTCLVCFRTFITETDLNRHMRFHLEDNCQIRCHKCNMFFTRSQGFRQHLTVCKGRNGNCSGERNEVGQVKEEIKNEVGEEEEEYENEECENEEESSEEEDEEMMEKDEEDVEEGQHVQCEACNQTFLSNQSLKDHVQRVHFPTSDLSTIENSVDITPVGVSSKPGSGLSPYASSCVGTGMIQCEVCFKSFARKDSLKKHMKVFHTYIPPVVLHTNVYESKPIQEANELKPGFNLLEVVLQEAVDSGVSTGRGVGGSVVNETSTMTIIQCQICKKTFTRKDSLKKHMKRFHIVDDRVKKEFNEGEINRNMLEVILKESGHEIKSRIPCGLCYKTFTRRDSLRKHMKIFHTRRNFNNLFHQTGTGTGAVGTARTGGTDETTDSTHNSDVPNDRIPCALCDKSFTRKDSLKKHISIFHTQNQTHDGFMSIVDNVMEENFIGMIRCELCDKTFTRKDSLKKHNKIFHDGEDISSSGRVEDEEEEEETDPVVSDQFLEVVLNEEDGGEQRGPNEMSDGTGCKLNVIRCKICSRTFTRNYNLKKHMKTVHKVMPFYYFDRNLGTYASSYMKQAEDEEGEEECEGTSGGDFGSLSNSMLEVIIKEDET